MLPGGISQAIEDVDFLAPFKFYRHEPRTVIQSKLHPRTRPGWSPTAA